MNSFIARARSPSQAAYYRMVDRFLWALIAGTLAWLVVLCLKGAVLLYGAPAEVGEAAYWLSWAVYPPAAVEVLVGVMLLILFRPRAGADRAVHYAVPERIKRARWLLYGLFITPLATVWVA